MDTIFADVVNKVICHYPIEVVRIYLLSYKGKKAVWSIQSKTGEVILKKVPFDRDHIVFMIHAIDYLKVNGVHTPGVIRTHSGEGYVEHEGELFVLFEAVHGQSPDYDIEHELLNIMKGLASFHFASRGIECPTGTFPSFLLLEWREDYERKYLRLLEWKEQRLQATVKSRYDLVFLTHVDEQLEQCRVAMVGLDQSCFDQWVEETRIVKTLCHQDYAAGNLAIGEAGHMYVFDMDSMTVDIPIRDIRKILNKVMKQRPQWDLQLMISMMKAYQGGNPLSKEQYKVLAADLQFPHLFYGQISKYYERREAKWTIEKHMSRLNEMLTTELSKPTVVQLFLSHIDEVIDDG